MGPEALQAGEHIAVLRQFDLRLGIGRLGAHGKDVEDERGAVQNLDLEFALNIAELLGREFVVEDDHADFALGILFGNDVLADFFQLALAHVGHGTGAVHALGEAVHGDCARRFGQKFKFVKVFLRFALVLLLRDEAHENGRFCFGFGLYKFLHSGNWG